LESEPAKILGGPLTVSAQCNRVPVVDGHLMTVAVRTTRECHPAEVVEGMRQFRVSDRVATLPSALEHPICVRDEDDRPQPRLDRDHAGGMGVVVGRVRSCPIMGLKWTILCHNTLRGAAGGALLNAELLVRQELIARRSS